MGDRYLKSNIISTEDVAQRAAQLSLGEDFNAAQSGRNAHLFKLETSTMLPLCKQAIGIFATRIQQNPELMNNLVPVTEHVTRVMGNKRFDGYVAQATQATIEDNKETIIAVLG